MRLVSLAPVNLVTLALKIAEIASLVRTAEIIVVMPMAVNLVIPVLLIVGHAWAQAPAGQTVVSLAVVNLVSTALAIVGHALFMRTAEMVVVIPMSVNLVRRALLIVGHATFQIPAERLIIWLVSLVPVNPVPHALPIVGFAVVERFVGIIFVMGLKPAILARKIVETVLLPAVPRMPSATTLMPARPMAAKLPRVFANMFR